MSETIVLDPGIGSVIVAGSALLFVSAAYQKWRRLGEFGIVVANYQLIPASLASACALLLPTLEALVAVLLVPAATRTWAAATGAVLLLTYAGGVAVNLHRGRRDLDCGCAGPADRRSIAAWMVWRNVALAAVLGIAGVPWAGRSLAWADLVTIVGGLAVVTLLYTTLDQLLGRVMPRAGALRGSR